MIKENLLQSIWQKFIDVQEQLLKLRASPVSIIPDSAKIIGDKLFLNADENDKTDKVIEEFANIFQIPTEQIDISNNHFFVDSDTTKKIEIGTRRVLSEKASANFINFRPFPIIDGYVKKKESAFSKLKTLLTQLKIEYDFDKRERLQISISDLIKLLEISNSKDNIIKIPDIATIIFPVAPNLSYYILKKYPFIKENIHSKILITNSITTKNGYFSKIVYDTLNEGIGLELLWYKFIFKIKSDAIKKYNNETCPYELPELDVNDNSFCFYVDTRKDLSELPNFIEEEKFDFNLKYTRLKRFFDSYFGSQNVTFESVFNYSFNNALFNNIFFSDLASTHFDDISLSEDSMSIGIDFNWKDVAVEELVTELENKYPFIHFNLYNNHKCNLGFQIHDLSLDEIENQLRDKFPSIQTKRDDKKGILYFFQEYETIEQSHILGEILESEIETINELDAFESVLYDIPENKHKYFFQLDFQAKKESQMSSVKELRGYDFSAGKQYFGKLFKVKYPEMVFDISGEEFEKAKQLFQPQNISQIEPNLTGDLEKIFRLRNSFNNILLGNNLQNQNLKNFIFDSGNAKRIDDIDFHLNTNSETFIELDKHLLNKNINEPQKQAIIKTLLAEDLALIQGPPGTGKSTAIAEIIWQHIRNNPEERILLTSETNLAVDNAIDRIVNENHNLVKPIRIGGEAKLEMEGLQFSLDLMKRWVESGKIEFDSEEKNEEEDSLPQKLILLNWLKNISRRIEKDELEEDIFNSWKNILSEPTKEIRQIFFNNYIKNCNVIGATCSSIGEKNTKGNPTSFYRNYCELYGTCDIRTTKKGNQYADCKGELKFTTVIQDESSKATPAELALPLTYGKKNIIIGDHRQLPPLLDKEEFMLSFDFLLDRAEKEDDKKKIQKLKSFINKHFTQMEISHFERLFERIDGSLKGIFNLQYRMHPDINDVIKQFYLNDGGLECGLISPVDLGVNSPDMHNPASRYHGINIKDFLSKDNHVVWVDTKTPELLDGTSRINYGEVDAIREILTKLKNSESFNTYQSFWTKPEDQQIGIISFYGKQIRLLRNLRNEFHEMPIRVSTVDRFQGMERNIIIVSMVRSNCIAADKNQKADYNLYGGLGFPEQNSLGFAQSPNRLNVALSRAKRLLIIVGNSDLFTQNPLYKNVYNIIKEKGGIR